MSKKEKNSLNTKNVTLSDYELHETGFEMDEIGEGGQMVPASQGRENDVKNGQVEEGSRSGNAAGERTRSGNAAEGRNAGKTDEKAPGRKAAGGKAAKEPAKKVELTDEELRGAGRDARRGVKIKLQNPGALFKRLMGYVMKRYKWQFSLVVVCIFVSTLATVQGTMFIKNLIDDFITPLFGQAQPDFGPLAAAILRVAIFYALGVLANFVQQTLLVYIGQGTLRDLRMDMFRHMQSLPIRYFDTHKHGDIMSMYTNDIDTLRQMISQSMPQFISSAITIVSVLVSMIILSWPLTLVNLAMVALTLFVTGKVAGRSGVYFVEQQRNLGALNGYIEETMSGEKVVKVFNHEEEAIEAFNDLNDRLCDSADRANRFANIIAPINAQLGNLSYVVCAVVGGLMAIGGGLMTVGDLVAFLLFNKSFSMPINQISMQLNSVVMALAGAERIFRLLDEEPEKDEGYVTLVNARIGEDGSITETNDHTGRWAWKIPESDGSFC